MIKVLATIITYNPDMDLLISDIESICNQVYGLIIYDNASNNVNEIEAVVNNYSNVKLIKNEKNLGLPVNYNRASKLAMQKECDWLLILDQDSIMPRDIIERFSEYSNDETIGIICPQFRDVNLYSEDEFLQIIPKERTSFVDQCISSASLNRVSLINEVGGFDEKLFIDQVDFDYCKNLLNHGYKILQVNDCIIEHSIGNSKFVSIFGKKEISYNHSPFRKYYFFRNRIYFARKYHITPIKDFSYFRCLLKHFIVLFYEENKLKKMKKAIKGIIDGFKL